MKENINREADSWRRYLIWNIWKQIWHTLAVVSPAYSLGKHHRHIDALDFGAILHMAVLWNCVGHDDCFEASVVDARNGRATEDAVRENCINFCGARFDKLLSGMANRTTSVSHIIHQNGNPVFHITDEYHRSDFIRLLALLVNQSELDVQSISYRRDTLSTSGIRRDDDRIPPLRDVLLDPLQHGRLSVEIIDGNVEESLKLQKNIRRQFMMKICDNTVGQQPHFKDGLFVCLLLGKKEESALTNLNFLKCVEMRLLKFISTGKSNSLTWICDAWRSMVMMWSAPATDSILATSLAEIGARLCEQQTQNVEVYASPTS